jgi:mono/diheme cytochrome c family protein
MGFRISPDSTLQCEENIRMRKVYEAGLAALVAVGCMAGSAAYAQEADLAAKMGPLMTEGATVFADNCSVCHGNNGEGNVGPKLDGNDWVETRSNIINQVLFGATDHGMPPFKDVLTDEQIAAVATYVRNSWSNSYGIVLPQSVTSLRSDGD